MKMVSCDCSTPSRCIHWVRMTLKFLVARFTAKKFTQTPCGRTYCRLNGLYPEWNIENSKIGVHCHKPPKIIQVAPPSPSDSLCGIKLKHTTCFQQNINQDYNCNCGSNYLPNTRIQESTKIQVALRSNPKLQQFRTTTQMCCLLRDLCHSLFLGISLIGFDGQPLEYNSYI